MAEYTYADVIIDPNDPRVEIGKEYYFEDTAMDVLKSALDAVDTSTLEEIFESDNFPFKVKGVSSGYACLIRKKEPEKKYVPFDLSKEEDRAKLRGAWIRPKDDRLSYEGCITQIQSSAVGVTHPEREITPEELLDYWKFVDGTPCGKLVEVE